VTDSANENQPSRIGWLIFWSCYPFAVPDKIFGLTHFLDFIDRGTHCALAASATGSARTRDQIFTGFASSKLYQLIKNSHPGWDDCFFGAAIRLRCPIKSSGLRISSILSTAALTAPSLHLPQAALGLVTKFSLASPVQICTY